MSSARPFPRRRPVRGRQLRARAPRMYPLVIVVLLALSASQTFPEPVNAQSGDRCGATENPWGYTFCTGSTITDPPREFCQYFSCIGNFWNGRGYVVQCRDGMFGKSGGIQGSCSGHGGNSRALLQGPVTPPTATSTATPLPQTATPTTRAPDTPTRIMPRSSTTVARSGTPSSPDAEGSPTETIGIVAAGAVAATATAFGAGMVYQRVRTERHGGRPSGPQTPRPPTHARLIRLDKRNEIVTLDCEGDMTGWKLVSHYGGQTFRFPNGFIGHGRVQVRSGIPMREVGPSDLWWTARHVWNDTQPDGVSLVSPEGRVADTLDG